MRLIIHFALLLFFIQAASAQHTFKAVLKDASTGEALLGALINLKGETKGVLSDAEGKVVLNNIPEGKQTFVFAYLGYATLEKEFIFPLPDEKEAEILLIANAEETDEIIIEGTRSNRSIEDIPTRVEALTEEIDEASTMDPSKIAHLITHSTGIQVQQTSATSNTANVRIQGLDGRYTQILKDGFPIYGGFSGSLSIMQIPPLDLRQVEYIKGGASTLYGAGAIAGLINLLSKEPDKEETLIHLNASQIGAVDVNAYMSRKFSKMGFTLLAQRNTHKYFDADKDGFTDMPELIKFNLNPKIFFYFTPKTKLNIGATLTNEVRRGGDIQILKGLQADSSHFYQEKNDINRTTTQLKLDHQLSETQKIEVRNSFNIFKRVLNVSPSFNIGDYKFAGNQLSSFSEVAYSQRKNKNVFIAGLNFYTDDFKEQTLRAIDTAREEHYKTIGAFANYVFDLGKKVSLETGLRADYVSQEKIYILPRVSALFKWTNKLTTRIGGGMGYRNASIFNQEAEIQGYRNVLSINRANTKAEESFGGNFDLGYKTPINDNMYIIFNQMFFYSRVQNPLALQANGNKLEFVNRNGYTQSYGAETFFKLGFYDFVWFVGYTYTNATNHFDGNKTILTLTPQHSIKGDILYALTGKWRIGFDYEFKSGQTLSSGRLTRSYWTTGAVVEYTKNQYTLFGNIENFANIKQTIYENLKSLPYNTPQYTEVWAPLDGFVFNAGFKIRLGELAVKK